MLEPSRRSLQVSWRPEGPDGAVARFVFRVLGAGEVGVAGTAVVESQVMKLEYWAGKD